MPEVIPHDIQERVIIRYRPHGPVDLAEFAGSLAAIEKIFESSVAQDRAAPEFRLYVDRIEHGSIEVYLLPMLQMLGGYIEYMSAVVTLRDFTVMVIDLLKRFSEEETGSMPVDAGTANQIREFIKPLTGKKGAALNIRHARYHRKNGDDETTVEYNMEEPQINLAAMRLERQISVASHDASPGKHSQIYKEVLMRLDQAKMSEGKEKGRTGDRAVIAAITERDLPLYFPKEVAHIKDRIISASDNPFSKGYIVDAVVEFINGEPKLFRVIDLHEIIDI